MKTETVERREPTLDDAIAAVREDEAPAAAALAAQARVRAQLAAHDEASPDGHAALRGCDDVRASASAYRRGELAAARALLVEDHLRECPACRAALGQPGARPLAVLPWRKDEPRKASVARSRPRLAIAAAAVLALGLSAYVARDVLLGIPPGSRAAVQSVTGAIHRVGTGGTPVLAPGQEVGEDEAVRTTRGSKATLRLRDGSVVEMSERAELRVTARGQDTTIHLERGGIIVQAAKRRSGRLLVASRDCTVQVTGTVFSVNRGLTGSRVSVIEGQVKVSREGEEKLLTPGDQWVTSPAMGAVPLRDEISWSGDADRHLALLAEVKALRQMWSSVPTPGVRHESRLLGLVSGATVVYAAVPNYGEALAEAHRLFEERLSQSAVLQEFWTQADPARRGGPSLALVIEKVRNISGFLGEEIVLTMAEPAQGRGPVPVLLADVRRPGLQEALEQTLAELASHAGGKAPAVQVVTDGVLDDAGPRADVYVLLRGDIVAITPDRSALQMVAARLDGAGTGIAGTPFGSRIAEAYERGAGILIAANLEQITKSSPTPRDPARAARQRLAFQRSGLDGLRHLIFERQHLGGEGHTQAVLSFDGERRGVPSWLAAPAPMGALEFVSPDAHAASAFVIKAPSLVLDDVMAMAAASSTREDGDEVAELQAKLGLRLREDLAETLGGEFLVAVDGPLLPTPAWKVVLEVYDPARLQESLQLLLSRANEELAQKGRPELRLVSEQLGGQIYHAVRGGAAEVHYAFVDGYLVAAPSRALVMRALQIRDSGFNLGASPSFRALFPADRGPHVSALLYQNLGAVVSSLLGPAGPALSDAQRDQVQALAGEGRPTLVVAFGEEHGIRMSGAGGVFDLDISQLGLPMLLNPRESGTPKPGTP